MRRIGARIAPRIETQRAQSKGAPYFLLRSRSPWRLMELNTDAGVITLARRELMDGWMTMPTSDADRYAQLRQNLAVGLDAIREAIEMASGVTLPTASTLNAEFEIITNAIYTAADQPRPVQVIDDKPTTRTHFVYRIDILTDDAKNILEHLAGMENLIVARAAYRAACERWPNAKIRCARARGS